MTHNRPVSRRLRLLVLAIVMTLGVTQLLGFDLASGSVLSAPSGRYFLHENAFGAAYVLTPSSQSSNGEFEVLFSNGVSAGVRHRIATHRARASELSVGTIVLWNENFPSGLTEVNYRFGAWRFGEVTGIDRLDSGVVAVNNVDVPLVWLRIQGEAPHAQSAPGVAGARRLLVQAPMVNPQSPGSPPILRLPGMVEEPNDEIDRLAERINNEIGAIDRLLGNPVDPDVLADPAFSARLESIVADTRTLNALLRQVLQQTISPSGVTRVPAPRRSGETIALYPAVVGRIDESVGRLDSIVARVRADTRRRYERGLITDAAGKNEPEEEYASPETELPCDSVDFDLEDSSSEVCDECCLAAYPVIEVDGTTDAEIEEQELQNATNTAARLICILACVQRMAHDTAEAVIDRIR